jgi:hypothetical protein
VHEPTCTISCAFVSKYTLYNSKRLDEAHTCCCFFMVKVKVLEKPRCRSPHSRAGRATLHLPLTHVPARAAPAAKTRHGRSYPVRLLIFASGSSPLALSLPPNISLPPATFSFTLSTYSAEPLIATQLIFRSTTIAEPQEQDFTLRHLQLITSTPKWPTTTTTRISSTICECPSFSATPIALSHDSDHS